MVAATTTRRVLEAVASAIPDVGHNMVTRVDIHDGWGGAVHVRIHTQVPRDAGADLAEHMRKVVGSALRSRHRVEMVWASPG